jgi:hypothetical protein
LFREEPSTELEVDVEDCEQVQHAIEGDAGKVGWDILVDDLSDDEGFVDHDEDDVFVQDIV